MSKKITIVETLKDLQERKTANDIASFLERAGCRGRIGEANSCPVANYLKRNPNINSASVSCSSASADGESVYLDQFPAVRDFVTRFDRREFPQLIG